MLGSYVRKRSILLEEDEEDDQPTIKQKLPKVDVDISPKIPTENHNLKNFVIYVGDGLYLELKEFRKCWYLNISRYGDHAVIKNRFNIKMKQFPEFLKGIEIISNYLRNK